MHDLAPDLLEELPCGIAVTGPDGGILVVNRTLADWLRAQPDEVRGRRRLQDLLTAPGRIYFETHVAPMLRLQGFVREIACQLRRPGAEPLPVLLNAVLRRGSDGEPQRIDFTLFDATERALYEHSLRQARREAEELASIVTSSDDAILRVGVDGTILSWNGGATRLLGVGEHEATGQAVETVLVLDDRPGWFTESASGAAAGERQRFEARLGSGQEVEVTVTAIREPSRSNATDSFSVVARDISELLSARRRAEMIAQELNHRVKNILSVVIGIARLTVPQEGKGAPGRKLVERLIALSRANDMLIGGNWEQVAVGDLVAMTVQECGGDERFRVGGPHLTLGAKQAAPFSLALHELATNSFKYGALSVPGGRIELTWSLAEAGDELRLTWCETCGPPVVPPPSRGFGSWLIENALAAELGGKVELEFRPEGLVCRLRAPYRPASPQAPPSVQRAP